MKKLVVSLLLTLLCLQVGAQAPHAVFQGGMHVDIEPQGWIKEFLRRQQSGLTGHPEALSYPYDSSLWAGEIRRNTDSYGSDWWRYEQTAYYSDGLLRLGYLLRDPDLIEKGEVGIRYTLENASKTGKLGNPRIETMWPMCVYFRVMQAYYERTGDPEIPRALEKHYLNFSKEEVEQWRNIVSIEGMLWTFGKTANRKLLETARQAYDDGKFGDLTPELAANDERLSMHGVTCMEELKLPMLLYAYTGEHRYLELAVNAERKLTRDHMLPDGVPASAEALVGNENIINSHETCDITDYTWTLEQFLLTTGDVAWADKIEKAVFNAGPGAVTKDFRALQYFSSVNQVIATGRSNHNAFFHGSTWMAYRPTHETECCSGNVHRFMPNYVTYMWLRRKDGAIAAALYGPSCGTFDLPDGKTCRIEQHTEYPFEGEIEFRFFLDGKAEIPFLLRIPDWCDDARISVNGKPWKLPATHGTFVTIRRNFRNGDRIRLSLAMKPHLTSIPGQGVYLQRGPLVFSYAVPQHKTEDQTVYANMNGKTPANPAFKCWSIEPAGAWNYALCTDSPMLPEVIHPQEAKPGSYPFEAEQTPVKIRVPAKKIRWELEEERYTPRLPEGGVAQPISDTVEYLDLIPYGCTELRLTVFPVTE